MVNTKVMWNRVIINTDEVLGMSLDGHCEIRCLDTVDFMMTTRVVVVTTVESLATNMRTSTPGADLRRMMVSVERVV